MTFHNIHFQRVSPGSDFRMLRFVPVLQFLCSVSAKNTLTLAPKLCSDSILTLKRMSSNKIEGITKVDIDPSGVFKYILIKVHDPKQNNEDSSITIVRGYKRCNYHSDIYDEVQPQLEPLDAEPLGGGRMSHEPNNKKIHIYGYSQGYGKADHEITARLVKDAYPGYTVTISDEGY